MVLTRSVFCVSAERPVDDLTNSIDARIIQHQVIIRQRQDEIRRLKSERNELAPISRLPAEVLGHIFGHIVAMDRLGGHRYLFTHVSQWWRATAIKDASLWTDIVFRNINWVDIQLERSKGRGLSLYIECPFPDFYRSLPRFRKFLDSSFSRVREFELVRGSELVIWSLFRDRIPATPNLQVLRFVRCARFLDIVFKETVELRRLETIGVDWNWTKQQLNSVTYLKIHGIDYPFRPSWFEFFAALRRMPALETLDLMDSLPAVSPNDSNGSANEVTLPKLRTLRLKGGMQELSKVVSSFSLPSSTRLKFVCWGISSYVNEISTLLAVLTKRRHDRAYRALSVTGYERYGLRLRAWKDTRSQYIAEADFSIDLKLDPQAPNSSANLLKKLSSLLPLQDIRTVSLGAPRIRHKTLVQTLGRLPMLKWVHVIGEGSDHLISSLTHKPRDSDTAQDKIPSVAFPALRSLWIDKASFNMTNECGVDIFTLQDCLIQRRKLGVPLKKLVLTRCTSLDPEEVDLLDDVLDDVYWDGNDVETSDEE